MIKLPYGKSDYKALINTLKFDFLGINDRDEVKLIKELWIKR